MRLDNNAIGQACPKCRREITQNVVDDAKARKISNAIQSRQKAAKNGNANYGRPRIRDDNRIRKLRSKGLSMRDIANFRKENPK